MDTKKKILDSLELREYLRNAVVPILFFVMVIFTCLYWLKEKSSPVAIFKGEVLRLASPTIGRGTEDSPKTNWVVNYFVKLGDGKIINVEVPDIVVLKPGTLIRVSGYRTALGNWSYTFVARDNSTNAQPGGPAEATAGENRPLPPR